MSRYAERHHGQGHFIVGRCTRRHYALCHFAECYNAKCHHGQCHFIVGRCIQRHYAEFRYDECHYARCVSLF